MLKMACYAPPTVVQDHKIPIGVIKHLTDKR